jgi:hypothetical protein
MTKDRELKLLERIASLERIIKDKLEEPPKIPSYSFGKITVKELRTLFDLERVYDHQVFNHWFNCDVQVTDEEVNFLTTLLEREIDLIKVYNEEDLKIHFIAPILNKIDYKSFKYKIRDFYEETLVYETPQFILSGIMDFVVATGLEYPENPYFFIQEFKKGLQYSNPEPQLLAELIAAVELNNVKTIKGAYIIGGNWSFMILTKLAQHKYQYSISQNYDSTDLDKLIAIYKNLQFVKQQIIPTKPPLQLDYSE